MAAPGRRIRRMSTPSPEEDEETTPEEAAPRSKRPPAPTARDTGDDGDEDMTIRGGWSEGQKQMDAASPFAQALKLEEKGQIIKFLDDVPYANFRRHWIDRASQQGGTVRRPFTCLATLDRDCPLCEIGDRTSPVSAFNVIVIGDDGQHTLKTFDTGARVYQVLKAYNNDPKVGPLSKHYFMVSKTGKMSNSQTNVTPIKTSALAEDWDTDPISDEALAKLAKSKYDGKIVEIPKHKDLAEIAAEIADEYE